jgi:PAS domain S-box-containing protein
MSASTLSNGPGAPNNKAPPPTFSEDRSLRPSASMDQSIMDLFRTSQDPFGALDVSQGPLGAPGQGEDRSLKKASIQGGAAPLAKQSSDSFLLSNALGAQGGGNPTPGAPNSTSLGGENFVLEWAYSVDPDEWQKLEHLNEMKNIEMADANSDDAKSSANSNDSRNGPEASHDEEYVPDEVTSGGRSGRKRRATARAVAAAQEGGVVENDGSGSPGDDESRKRKCTWRKYGQKVLKGKDFVGMDVIRCYFRCNVRGCKVKKQVEKASWQTNSEANVTVTGIHCHPVDETDDGAEEDDVPLEAQGASAALATRNNRSGRDPLPVPPLNTTFSNEIREASPHFVISDPSKPDCPIIFASPGFCRLTGYGLTEVVGRNCRFLQGKDSNPNAIRQISMACKLEKEIRVIILNYKKNGEPFWNLLHITPVKDQSGNLISYVGIQMDVSERYAL